MSSPEHKKTYCIPEIATSTILAASRLYKSHNLFLDCHECLQVFIAIDCAKQRKDENKDKEKT